MRQKVAKALKRAAYKFAQEKGRLVDRIEVIRHRDKLVVVPGMDLLPNGKLPTVRIQCLQDVVADGPRYFYRQLKKAYRRGALQEIQA